MRINGWAVPVKDVSVELKDIGSRSTSHAGNPLTDIRTIKRIVKGKTAPMIEMDAEAFKGVIRGAGDHWSFNNNAYSDKGLFPNTTNGIGYLERVAGDGDEIVLGIDSAWDVTEYGATKTDYMAFVAHSDMTNILSSDQSTAENGSPPAGFTAIGGSTITNNTQNYVQGSQSLRCTTYSPGDGVETNQVAKDGTSNVHIGSVFLKSSSGNIEVDLLLWDDNGGVINTQTCYLSDDKWQRCYVYGLVDIAASNVKLQIVDTDGDGVTFYADKFQIEKKDPYRYYPHQWIEGGQSRTGGTPLYVPNFLNNGSDMTISFWSPAVPWFGDSAYFRLNDAGGLFEDTNGITISKPSYNYRRSSTQVDALGTGQFYIAMTSNVTDPSLMVTHVYKTHPETGEYHGYIYINGVLEQYTVLTDKTLPRFNLLQYLHLNKAAHNGAYEDLLIVPYAMPVAQILGMYNMNGALPTLPSFYVDGDIFTDAEEVTLFQGRITNVKYIQAGDSSWRNNWQEIEFELIEV